MFSLLAAVNVGDSVQTALDSFFGFLPKLIGFIIVLAIGWIVAKVVKAAVTKLLQKVGSTRPCAAEPPVNTSTGSRRTRVRRAWSGRWLFGSSFSAR